LPDPSLRLWSVSAVSSNDVWAVGGHVRAHWDGHAWSLFPVEGPDGELVAVSARASDDVWAVGAGTLENHYGTIEHWDGTKWSVIPTAPVDPSNPQIAEFDGVAAFAANDVWAVGKSWPNWELIEHWDGTAWTVSKDLPVGSLFDVGGASASDVWAVGSAISENLPIEGVDHWDGTGWTALIPFPPDRYNNGLFGVAAATSQDVWVGGTYGRLAHWDGRGWRLAPLGNPPGPPDRTGFAKIAATPSGGSFWAVGWKWRTPIGAWLCPVGVSGSGFSQALASVPQGSTVAWSFPAANGEDHTVTDASGLGMFDSGPREPGSSFTTTLSAAGRYPIIDTATGNTSAIKVAPKIAPSSGSPTTAFTLTWASQPAASGWAYDVQIKRPGTSSYVYWRHRTTDPSATFTADAGPGTYAFRARLRNTANWKASGWSSAITPMVTE
jgi:hypothetical protein